MSLFWTASALSLAAAVFTVVPEDARLTSSDGVLGDWFGLGVALSGDYLAVSAPGADGAATGAGKVYIFKSTDGGASWVETQVSASDGAESDALGTSYLAIDGSVCLAGARAADSDTGAAYFFRTTDGGSSWSQIQKVTASDAAAGARFGNSVGIAGNMALVGAPSANGVGQVYAFQSLDGGASWAEVQILSASDGGPNHYFGFSVAISADTAIVGAFFATGPAIFAGAAYVYRHGGSSWTQIAKLTGTGTGIGDSFGTSVALLGDVAVVGTPSPDSSQGAAWVFVTSDDWGTWTETKLTASGLEVGDRYGLRVEVSPDFIVVGAQQDGDAAPNAGAAYVYATNDGGASWTEHIKLTPSDAVEDGRMGTMVAVEGSLIVAADNNPSVPGTVYVLHSAEIDPGAVGDPMLVDFFGHQFMGGSHRHTEYVLFRSESGVDEITITTGDHKGHEGGYFVAAATVRRAGCGAVTLAASTESHTADVSGDACMLERIAYGDEGLVMVPIGNDGTVAAVFPHHQRNSAAFVNIKLLGSTPEFRKRCTGMLCDETHVDAEA